MGAGRAGVAGERRWWGWGRGEGVRGRAGRRLGGAVARWVGGFSRLSAAAAAAVVAAAVVAAVVVADAVVNVVSAVAVLVAAGCARGAAIYCGP